MHGTDCPEWYAWAADPAHMPDEEFAITYGTRPHLLDVLEDCPFTARLRSILPL